MVAEAVARRQVASDVPEFLEVVRIVALGGFDPERRIAASAAAARDEILALHVLRQSKKSLRFFLGAMDQLATSWVLGKRAYRLTDAADAVATIFLKGVSSDGL